MATKNKVLKELNRRQFLSFAAAGGLTLGTNQFANDTQAKMKAIENSKSRGYNPNILWICTDQQRYDTIAALGNPIIRTPNLDKLVTEGVAFRQAFAQSTVCTPSRAAFMTSRYPHLTGARGNGFDIRENEIPVSKIFAEAGYHCGLIGKLHLSSSQGHVERRIDDGYAEFIWSHDPFPQRGWEGKNQYIEWLKGKGYQWRDVYKPAAGKHAYAGVPTHLHQTTWCFEQGMDFITRNRERCWFLSINVFAPHHPFDPSEEYLKRYDPEEMPNPAYQPGELANKPPNQTVDHNGAYGGRLLGFAKMKPSERREVTAAYYAMIEQIDDQIGRLMKKLEETGQKENTIVVFTSDHGEMLGNHGIYLKGQYPYDDLIHVPLIISWPGHFEQGLKSDALVELVDIAPTLLEGVGYAIPTRMQGRSFLNICTGKAKSNQHREYVFAECYDVTPFDKSPVCLTMIRDRKHKIAVYHGLDIGELYDLEEDPHEFINLWDNLQYQKLKNELLKKCFDAQISRLDPIPLRRAEW